MRTALFALLIACVAAPAAAQEWHLLEPSKMTMEYFKIANNRDEYLAINDIGSTKYGEGGETWRYGVATDFDLDLIRYGQWALYWDNHVHMAATQCCVRHVGWEFEWGAEISKHADLFYYHHSEHIMDLDRPVRRYPLQNMYGVRLVFIESGRK